ncbi:MAG: hypothetical protein RSA29_05900 [Clostridium sp.]|uniref:hypothetical protein n=1 Tax=Clostridium sp. TaxID=1506 RepID=UPI002FCA7CCE
MAKAGMKRPGITESHGTESNKHNHFPKNQTHPVPELQGKAKTSDKKAKPISYDDKW